MREDHDVGACPGGFHFVEQSLRIDGGVSDLVLVLDLRAHRDEVVAALDLDPVACVVNKPTPLPRSLSPNSRNTVTISRWVTFSRLMTAKPLSRKACAMARASLTGFTSGASL